MNQSTLRRRALALAWAAWACAPLRAAEWGELVAVQIGPFGAGASTDAQALNQGLVAAIEEANARGGVRGRRLKLITLDDRRDADLFVKRFHEAMVLKPVALLSPLGSTLVKRLLDDRLLEAVDTVVLNAIPGAEVLRSPGHPRLFHIRAGDRQQIQYLVRHAATLGTRRLVVWHQDTPAGRSGAGLASAGLPSSAGTAPVPALETTAVESAADAPAMATAALKVKQAGASSALVLGSPTFMAEAVRHLRTAGHSGPIYAPADLPLALLLKVAGEAAARGVSIARCVPNPQGVAQPVQRAFAAAMRTAHPDVSAYTALQMEGYLTARVLVEGLRRAFEPLRPAVLADALRAGPMDLGGFRVDFRDSQAGSGFVDIGVVTAGGRLAH